MSISILIPHKNSLAKVCRLLQSIPDDIAIVLVDDYSDNNVFDDLKEVVVEKYHNVKLIRNDSLERNAGTARNFAMKNCPVDTKWAIFADADDEFNTVALKNLMRFLADNESDDVVFFNCVARKEHRKEESSRCDNYRRLISSWPSSNRSIAFKWPVPWGKAIRMDRVIIPNALEFASRSAGNDMEFSTKLALTHPVVNVFSEDVYVCYESNNSLTANLTPQKALDRLKGNINCNRLCYSSGIEFIRYNYALTFFFKAFPLIIKNRDFSVLMDEARNFFLAARVNLFVKSRYGEY